MSGFVAGGTPTAHPISNDSFWPDIDGTALREAMRIGAAISDARLEVATVAAMLYANRELAVYRAARIIEGHTQLSNVPAPQLGGTSELVHLYRRAVYCAAAAELLERHYSYDSTGQGNHDPEQDTTSAEQYRRDARKALRGILGISHATVELL